MMTQQDILDLLNTLVPGDYVEQLKPSRLYLYMVPGGVGTYYADETVASAGGVQWRVWSWDAATYALVVTPLSKPVTPYVAGDVLTGPSGTWTVQSVRGYKESGPGYELFQAYAKMMERASVAGAVSANSLFISQAVGASRATGQVSLTRTPHAANDCRVTYYKGTRVSTRRDVVRPGGWVDTLALNDYELTADVTFSPTEAGPKTVAVQSVKYGYQQNVGDGTVVYPHEPIPDVAPAYIVMMTLPIVGGPYQVNEIVEGATNGARFRCYNYHAGTGALVLIPTGTNIAISVGEVMTGEITGAFGNVAATYRYLDEFNDLTVTNAAAMTGGTWPSLDALGDERGIYRQTGIPDREVWLMQAGPVTTYTVGELVEGRTYRLTMTNPAGVPAYVVGEALTAPGSPGALWTCVSWDPATLTLVVSDAGWSPPQTSDTVTGAGGAIYDIAAQDPMVYMQWKVTAWDNATRVLQLAAAIPGPRFVPWQQVTGRTSGALWVTDQSTSYTAGGSESDDDYRDRIQTDLDVVSKPGLLRTIVRKIITAGYRFARIIEGWEIGCFLSETGDDSTRDVYMAAGGAYTTGETVIDTVLFSAWTVHLYDPAAGMLRLSLNPIYKFTMVGGGVGVYTFGDLVTGTAGGTGAALSWNPGTRELVIIMTNTTDFIVGDHVTIGGVDWVIATVDAYVTTTPPDIAVGNTLFGLTSATARVIDHYAVAPTTNDGRTAIAWDLTDILPHSATFDLTGWVILDNAEMRGSFVVILPDMAPPNDALYPAIYDAIVRMKAAGVYFAAMYRDVTYNPITVFPVPVIPSKPIYPGTPLP